MRQKFVIQKNDEQQKLIVQEYAELDKDILSFICEERHDLAKIETALQKGREALIAALRTDNMYPPVLYARAIADVIIENLAAENALSQEIVFDDNSYVSRDQNRSDDPEDIDDEDGELEDLLDDDLDDDFEDKKIVKSLKSSIRIADDDGLDTDDEN